MHCVSRGGPAGHGLLLRRQGGDDARHGQDTRHYGWRRDRLAGKVPRARVICHMTMPAGALTYAVSIMYRMLRLHFSGTWPFIPTTTSHAPCVAMLHVLAVQDGVGRGGSQGRGRQQGQDHHPQDAIRPEVRGHHQSRRERHFRGKYSDRQNGMVDGEWQLCTMLLLCFYIFQGSTSII